MYSYSLSSILDVHNPFFPARSSFVLTFLPFSLPTAWPFQLLCKHTARHVCHLLLASPPAARLGLQHWILPRTGARNAQLDYHTSHIPTLLFIVLLLPGVVFQDLSLATHSWLQVASQACSLSLYPDYYCKPLFLLFESRFLSSSLFPNCQ